MDNSRFKFRAFVPWLGVKVFEVEKMCFDSIGVYSMQLFAGEYHRYEINSELSQWEKEPPILIQSTGLYDCEGKEIWEGDIVEYCFTGSQKKSIVRYESGSFVTDDVVIYYSAENNNVTKFKVIGNRFESPEILEIKK